MQAINLGMDLPFCFLLIPKSSSITKVMERAGGDGAKNIGGKVRLKTEKRGNHTLQVLRNGMMMDGDEDGDQVQGKKLKKIEPKIP